MAMGFRAFGLGFTASGFEEGFLGFVFRVEGLGGGRFRMLGFRCFGSRGCKIRRVGVLG